MSDNSSDYSDSMHKKRVIRKGKSSKKVIKSRKGEEEMTEHNIECADDDRPLRFKKLVVPHSMRSIYWRYFGFPATEDGLILSRFKIVCTQCRKQILYNHNTSNLRTHLQSKHKSVIEVIDKELVENGKEVTSKRKKKNKIDRDTVIDVCGDLDIEMTAAEHSSNVHHLLLNENGLIDASGDSESISVIFPDGHQVQDCIDGIINAEGISSVDDAFTDFIVSDLHQPDIVHNRGFHRLLSSLQSSCRIPTKNMLADELLPKLYETCKYALLDNLSSRVGDVTLSIEQWTSTAKTTYISFFINYQQQDESTLFTRMLASIRCTSLETVSDWILIVDKLICEWNISPDSIKAVVSAFANDELKLALEMKEFLIIPCFSYVLQHICQTCFEHSDVASLLIKARAIVSDIFLHNNKDIISFQDENYLTECEDDVFMTDYPDIWVSTYYMLKGILLRKSVITSLHNQFDQGISMLQFNDGDWEMVEEIVQLLEPLKVIATTLNEERTPLLSLLKPIIWQITNNNYNEAKDDSLFVRIMKSKFVNILQETYSVEKIDVVLNVAATLDPRFKTFLQDNDLQNVDDVIKYQLIDMLSLDGTKIQDISEEIEFDATGSKISSSSQKKYGRQSGINAIFGSLRGNKSTMSVEERARIELTQYQSESSAMLEDCPLEWWNRMHLKCPNMKRLVQKYNCIPAMATACRFNNVQDTISFYIKRASLFAPNSEQILFLHFNQSLFVTESTT